MALVAILGQTGGDGITFPATPSAGDTPIFALYESMTSGTSTSFVNKGRTLTFVKAGTYRISFNLRSGALGNNVEARLVKNGTEISGSLISSTSTEAGTRKTIDVNCAAGDVVNLQLRRIGTASNAFTDLLIVSILAADMQNAINEIVTAAAV